MIVNRPERKSKGHPTRCYFPRWATPHSLCAINLFIKGQARNNVKRTAYATYSRYTPMQYVFTEKSRNNYEMLINS